MQVCPADPQLTVEVPTTQPPLLQQPGQLPGPQAPGVTHTPLVQEPEQHSMFVAHAAEFALQFPPSAGAHAPFEQVPEQQVPPDEQAPPLLVHWPPSGGAAQTPAALQNCVQHSAALRHSDPADLQLPASGGGVPPSLLPMKNGRHVPP